jgi:hypothetical protein
MSNSLSSTNHQISAGGGEASPLSPEVAGWVREITASRNARTRLLEELMSHCQSRGGVFWELEGNGNSLDEATPRADIVQGLDELGVIGDQQLARTCSRLALQAMAGGCPSVCHPTHHPSLPPQFSLLVIPFLRGRQPVAAIQLFVDSVEAQQQEAEWLHRFAALTTIPGGHGNGNGHPHVVVKTEPTEPGHVPSPSPVPVVPSSSGSADEEPAPATRPGAEPNEETLQGGTAHRSPDLTRFLLELHRTLRLDHVAGTAVNDGRRILGCDRVILAIHRGKGLEIAAISGVERVNRRSDEVQALLRVAREAVRAGEPLVFSGDAERVPPQLEQPLAEYLHLSHSRMMQLVPLHRSDVTIRSEEDDDEPQRSRRPKVIGCLIAESFSDTVTADGAEVPAEEVASHVSLAVHNALTLRKVPAVGIWRLFGAAAEWLHGRRLTKLLVFLACVAAIILTMTFVPYEYRVTADGRLVPVHKQRIFAPWDGDVVEVLIQSGQRVTAGTPLVRLENEELRQQLVEASNDLLEKRQQELALRAETDAARREGDDEKELRLRGELVETQKRITSLAERVAILKSRYEKLTVTAPADGVVVTFQLEQLLRHRPVTRGDELLELMRDDGPWELEVEIPDYRMGHLLRYLEQSGSSGTRVEFILQTGTEESFYGQLVRDDLGTRSTLSRDGDAVVQARIAVDDDVLPTRRIGAEVTAKIDCGRMNLGYVLFGDVVEFFRRRFWL